jgi:predicted pyridoxine 5'-phosphate oxidase superfamily flavin-nucleotide-binding protein
MEASAPRDGEPFHAGEQAMHDRLGIRQRMKEIGQRVIRSFMPVQHQQFFAQLPNMLVGSVDVAGRPWACLLVGQPGSYATRITAGRVAYAEPTAWRPGEGEVLLCCAVPALDGGDRIELEL